VLFKHAWLDRCRQLWRPLKPMPARLLRACVHAAPEGAAEGDEVPRGSGCAGSGPGPRWVPWPPRSGACGEAALRPGIVPRREAGRPALLPAVT